MALRRPERNWTYEDLAALPEDGKRYEIIEGELFELTGPNLRHARTIMNVIRLVDPSVVGAGGVLFTAVFDVFFEGADPVEPDLALVLPEGAARQAARGVEGPPDLVIEVLSPSNRTHDVLTKRELYRRGGVREYWMVDPDDRSIEVVAFGAPRAGDARTFRGNEQVVSAVLPRLAFAAEEAFMGLDAIAAE
jgi:Uma2 family endonuclease